LNDDGLRHRILLRRQVMSDPFIGQIIQGGWNFAPRGYVACAGQQLSIAQNTALFALLGTNFGGNGQTTFGVPDLQGRAMIGSGNGAGLQPYVLGQKGGTENTTLLSTNMPQHTHSFNVASAKATEQTPLTSHVIGRATDGANTPTAVPEIYCPTGTPTDVTLAPNMIGIAGGSQPFSILSPFQVVTIVIATQGIFPSRN
jgi:microcystin-dependent protein